MTTMTDSKALEMIRTGDWSIDVSEAFAHIAARLREPAGVGGVEKRQAWYERQIETAQQAWAMQFGERFEHGDDVPEPDHFVALWLAERAAPQPLAEAQADEVVCLECGQPTMHMGQVCYACSHPAAKPAEAQAQGGGEVNMEVLVRDGTWVGTYAEWCRRKQTAPPSAPVGVDAHKATLASLVAAVSLLRRGGGSAAPSDAMLNMMLADYEKAIEASRNALAKQPVEVDELAQVIREVDGNHSLGAGALAEAILEKFPTIAQQPAAVDEMGELVGLLDEVRSHFTRDDDLPDDLLPRIDAALRWIAGGAK